jgi:DNA-binding response OmpR family regulator
VASCPHGAQTPDPDRRGREGDRQVHRSRTAGGNYETVVTYDGVTGLSKFRELNPDLVILDLMLPVLDGLEVARRIRKTSNTPIIILTAKDSVDDKVTGLDSGADDYLVKPFSIEELLARVRAHLRRVNPAVTGEVRVADLVMNLDGREVFRDGRRIELSAKEFELLELFARNPARCSTASRSRRRCGPSTPAAATSSTCTSATCGASSRARASGA